VSKCGFHIVNKKRDVLYPKRMKFSKYCKGWCRRGCKPDGTQLGFGRYGTQSCRAGRLSYRAIEYIIYTNFFTSGAFFYLGALGDCISCIYYWVGPVWYILDGFGKYWNFRGLWGFGQEKFLLNPKISNFLGVFALMGCFGCLFLLGKHERNARGAAPASDVATHKGRGCLHIRVTSNFFFSMTRADIAQTQAVFGLYRAKPSILVLNRSI